MQNKETRRGRRREGENRRERENRRDGKRSEDDGWLLPRQGGP
jgi:hypothetical protein